MSKTLIAGILVLAFGMLSIFGNYVQWAGAVRTTAKILTSKEQWVRRGSNYLKLQVAYEVDGKTTQSEVYVMPDDLDTNASDGRIELFYKKEQPSDVIAVATLQDKRKNIPWIIAAGAILSGVGLFFQFCQNSQRCTERQV